ncbi:hypothetical protein CFR78_03760 [Komagataeibacter rhaeticus]|uniref:hypothetical protein n=1 Tax=Komagataeibacter rhaeticus TaxID=215221 RepID=UPI0004D85B1A|nr:hypothetical protein [Komagataeibacter rhaeticus]KDU95876.1 hypothetical protein GLUCORHAEAF1_07195 [Komagataeibacter rhaeticus AF1]MBL7240106.1 hypothetical protein [Komagataeibacter rhaeticus]PYD54738.1 hypothetical protein CFR78_03760 [Komagataeibacter rhaeticus]
MAATMSPTIRARAVRCAGRRPWCNAATLQAGTGYPYHAASYIPVTESILFVALSVLVLSVAPARAENTGNGTAAGSQGQRETYSQWYTGSLVSPSGALTKAGVFAWEPYVAYSQPVGYLGSTGGSMPVHDRAHAVSSFTLYKYSLTNSVSLQMTPDISYGWRRGHGGTTSGLKMGDLPVDVMWRYLDADPRRYIPALSLFVGVAFPSGDYTRLGRNEDGVGTGTYTFRLALTEQSTYTLPGHHELRLRMWGTFRRALTQAHIADTSSYGTTAGFRGLAHPGMYGESGFSLEYGVNQKWVIAMDLARDWANGAVVRGHDAQGRYQTLTGQASGDWLVAPAVEYNWSPRFGVIAGVTAIFAGHNTGQVISPQVAFNSVF